MAESLTKKEEMDGTAEKPRGIRQRIFQFLVESFPLHRLKRRLKQRREEPRGTEVPVEQWSPSPHPKNTVNTRDEGEETGALGGDRDIIIIDGEREDEAKRKPRSKLPKTMSDINQKATWFIKKIKSQQNDPAGETED